MQSGVEVIQVGNGANGIFESCDLVGGRAPVIGMALFKDCTWNGRALDSDGRLK